MTGEDLRALVEEQAALRRVATLVARGAAPDQVCAAAVEEVGLLLPVDYAYMGRYEPDNTITCVAASSGTGAAAVDPVGNRLHLGGNNVSTLVFETGRPARVDHPADASGEIGSAFRERSVRSAVGTPIVVEGRVWGVMLVVSTLEQPPMPADIEARLSSFTELLATAVGNAESRAGLARLAQEQAALRRVATLVARGAVPEEVFAAATEEIGQLLPVDSAGMGRYEPVTELLATAIANAESGAGLARLAEEQAGLRRVATLVARGAPPEQVFAGVVAEVGQLLRVEYAGLARYGSAGTLTFISAWSQTGDDPYPPVGSQWTLGGKNVATLVFETGRSARVDRYADASGPVGVTARETGFRSSVGTPIIVEGRLWGVVIVGSTLEQPMPAGTESRLASFTELVATAIANAESHAELTESRARIVTTADESRRRIQRDLHDGAQQRLAHAMLVLKLTQRALKNSEPDARDLLAEGLRHAEQANSELRELAHGIMPSALTRGGLRAGVQALVSRIPLPVSVDVPDERLPSGVEAAAYFVVSEALTNVVKHARAGSATVTARAEQGELRVEISDDGAGGSDPARVSGLVGLNDRVEALGGTLEVTSPGRDGTTLLIEIPVEGQSSAESR